jgi:RimJ/RimL family protein N-acetyltransferase
MYGGDTRDLKPFTLQDALDWYQQLSSAPIAWVIEHDAKGVGIARLTVNAADRRARYAIGMFDITCIGVGLGTEATRLVLDYAFGAMSLHRVDLRVLEYNKRAIACYEKCGFVREGVEREGAIVEGIWETDVMMSVLDREHKGRVFRDSSSHKT